MDERKQIERAERLAGVLSRLGECAVDVLALLDALAMTQLKLDEDDKGTARSAWENVLEEMGVRELDTTGEDDRASPQ